MINSHELMIGNYLLIDGKMRKVNSLRKDRVSYVLDYCFASEGSVHLRYAEPIGLSEWWLLKLGFVATNSHWFRIGDADLSLNVSIEGVAFLQVGKFDTVSLNRKIDTIHGLQNLYSGVFGKELIFQ